MKALSFLILVVFCVPAHSQDVWTAKLQMLKRLWVAGEPIVADITISNAAETSSRFHWGNFYLDDSITPCVDRNSPPADAVQIPPGQSSEESPVFYKSGTKHTAEINISRICNMEISDPNLIGMHTICHVEAISGNRTCGDFSVVEPTGPDQQVFHKFPPNFRDIVSDGKPELIDDLLRDFPTSNYSAYILWLQGFNGYNNMTDVGPEKDLNHQKLLRKNNAADPMYLKSAQNELIAILTPWEQLYRNFPDFIYRPSLLYGLTRMYFRMNEPPKAIPLLKELSEKYPNTEQAMRSKAHKRVLEIHNLWKE